MLPIPFHCGRYVGRNEKSLGVFHIEWRKKTVRRMMFIANLGSKKEFKFQKDIQRFRLRTGQNKKGISVKNGEMLEWEKGTVYLFDNFQK